MVRVEHLTVHYGARRAIHDVNLELVPGELALLTGPSGCGKSTLARAICGLTPRTIPARVEGRVIIGEEDVTNQPLSELATRVGMVLQNPATQLFCATVQEELASGPHNLGLDESDVSDRIEWALQAMAITHLRGRLVRHLSSGEQQRVAIAATLAMRPEALVLDEPASKLDLTGVSHLVVALRHLCDDHNLAILVIEHRAELFAPLVDRVLFMDGGSLVADGSPGEVLTRRDLLDRLGVRHPWQTLQDYWEDLLPVVPMERAATSPPLVVLDDITVDLGSRSVLNEVSLSLYPGELVALVGDNGAGKSTIGRVLAGIQRPRRGEVRWQDGLRSPRVGLVLQDPLAQLFNDTVEEEIAFGPRNFRRYHPPHLEELLTHADLRERRRSGVLNLSAGQQQRLAVASVAALQPALLVVDEPTMGQDWLHLSQMFEFLLQMNRRGSSVLLITHDAKLICRYAPRVLVLKQGRIAADGAPRQPALACHAPRRGRSGSQEEVSHASDRTQ